MFCVREGENAVISFKNISENMLNISSDELFERFTRGDASRHTEGSGLGLSIARSLVQLQNGTIDITVDGDLFKVTITFGLLDPEQGKTDCHWGAAGSRQRPSFSIVQQRKQTIKLHTLVLQ